MLDDKAVRNCILGAFLLLLIAAIYLTKDFLMPVVLAFLLPLVLSPVVRRMKRWNIPEGFSAFLLVLMVLLGFSVAVYSLAGPLQKWVEDAPQMARQLESKVIAFRQAFEPVVKASKAVDELADSKDPHAQPVVITEPHALTTVATGAPGFIVKVGLVIVLLFFLLASGDMFHEKLVKSLPTLTDKKRALGIALDIERELSRYLLTITIINTALGATIAGAMFAIGMPNPVLWGVAAGLLNFIPYVGALVGVIIVAFVALVSIEDLSHALLAPAAYFLITALEGQFLTPVIVGRRLDMNPVAILLAVAFWGWIWGIVGALIAVPLLLSLKVISDRIEGMHGLSEFLGPRDQAPGAN